MRKETELLESCYDNQVEIWWESGLRITDRDYSGDYVEKNSQNTNWEEGLCHPSTIRIKCNNKAKSFYSFELGKVWRPSAMAFR